MIRLIIKGNRFVAHSMASERGIPFLLRNEIPASQVYSEFTSVGWTTEENLEKVSKWFVEDTVCKPGKGFAIGSLLHYSID